MQLPVALPLCHSCSTNCAPISRLLGTWLQNIPSKTSTENSGPIYTKKKSFGLWTLSSGRCPFFQNLVTGQQKVGSCPKCRILLGEVFSLKSMRHFCWPVTRFPDVWSIMRVRRSRSPAIASELLSRAFHDMPALHLFPIVLGQEDSARP
jgi:hypothetical protein